MDAFHIGAADDYPDDSRMFEAITSHLTDIDTTAIEQDTLADQVAEQSEPARPGRTESEPADELGQAATIEPEPQPEPRRPEPRPAPVFQPQPAPVAVAAPVFPPRRQPVDPTVPNYWGRHGLVGVYWIAILTGAIGQVIFFGSLFNLGIWGYFAAAIIATTAETVMVSSGDTALHLRAEGRRKAQWLPFILIAFLAATAASGMNLTHWWSKNPSMAVIFGGIAFLGFLLHVVHGIGEGTQYLAEKKKYDEAIAEQEAEQRAEADAARREQQRERELERQYRLAEQAATMQAPAEQTQPAPTNTAKKASSKPSKRLDSETARRWSEQHEHPGPSAVRKHFADQGYEVPAVSTLRAWINQPN